MPESGSGGAIDRPWTDLATALARQGELIARNELIALLLEELLAGLAAFEASGFEPFQAICSGAGGSTSRATAASGSARCSGSTTEAG
jgi:biotin-(acetyl-CoA carboxylase) ligase